MDPKDAILSFPRPPMIDETLARFLQEGLAIHVGTRDAQLAPSGARVTAARVDASGADLVVFLPQPAAPHVLPNLQANGQAAVVFVRPVDDRSCQVKGTFLGVGPATADDRAFVERQWDAFMAGLERVGIPRAIFAGFLLWPSLAIRIRATAVFDQTPGPNAGRPLP